MHLLTHFYAVGRAGGYVVSTRVSTGANFNIEVDVFPRTLRAATSVHTSPYPPSHTAIPTCGTNASIDISRRRYADSMTSSLSRSPGAAESTMNLQVCGNDSSCHHAPAK